MLLKVLNKKLEPVYESQIMKAILLLKFVETY